ncbi:alpha/beta fold hydrolase [Nakamurella antarctica]|uniref:Alpha/beta fold hydrolase n=2 Tax=Nakamurella antarctica TaxID=1902245 RepID=A0A3G8ZQV4_9ACTN|nr:alpha/beta fold hydrolase [Nakamurella antarctica]
MAPVSGRNLAVLRLRPVASAIRRAGRRAGTPLAVYRLQLAVRGWNGDGAGAISDGRWALAQIKAQYPGVPVILVGHSMGGRTAMRLTDDPAIVGMVGLAPWLESGDPIVAPAGFPLRVLHGSNDRIVPERNTLPYVARAVAAGVLVDRTVLSGTAHGMLRKWFTWHRLTAEAVLRFAS